MSNELLVALLGLVGSLTGSIIGVVKSSNLLTYRMSQLENRVKDQLSTCSVMDGRVDRLESRQDVMEEQIKVANHRISDLEEERR